MSNYKILNSEIKVEINKLQKPASLRWIFACIFNWLIVFTTFYTAFHYQNLWVDALAILVIGNRQHAIALLGHEGAHFMLSSNRIWNDILTGFFCFWPLGISLAGFREFHFTHHNSVGTINDPELKFKKAFNHRYELPITKTKMCFYFIKDVLCLSINEVFLVKKYFTSKKKRHLIIPNLYLGVIAVTLIYYGLLWVFVYWLIAIYSSFWAFFQIRVYIEHIGTSATHRVKTNPLLNLIFFPIGANTHWEHHQWPSMPYYHRKKIRVLIMDPPLIEIDELFKTYANQKRNIYLQNQAEPS